MIYRFIKPIKLSDGTILYGPAFLDDPNDKGEAATAIRAQAAKEQAEADKKAEVKAAK